MYIDDGPVGFVLGCLFAGLIGLAACFVASNMTEESTKQLIYKTATEKGFGEYKLDPKTGKIAFEWEDKKSVAWKFLRGTPNCCTIEGGK